MPASDPSPATCLRCDLECCVDLSGPLLPRVHSGVGRAAAQGDGSEGDGETRAWGALGARPAREPLVRAGGGEPPAPALQRGAQDTPRLQRSPPRGKGCLWKVPGKVEPGPSARRAGLAGAGAVCPSVPTRFLAHGPGVRPLVFWSATPKPVWALASLAVKCPGRSLGG